MAHFGYKPRFEPLLSFLNIARPFSSSHPFTTTLTPISSSNASSQSSHAPNCHFITITYPFHQYTSLSYTSPRLVHHHSRLFQVVVVDLCLITVVLLLLFILSDLLVSVRVLSPPYAVSSLYHLFFHNIHLEGLNIRNKAL